MDEDVKRWIYWAIPVIVVIGAGVAFYSYRHNAPKREPAAQTQPAATTGGSAGASRGRNR